MKTFDQKFVEVINQNAHIIEDKMCQVISEDNMCPSYEGVSCLVCLKYIAEIIAKSQSITT